MPVPDHRVTEVLLMRRCLMSAAILAMAALGLTACDIPQEQQAWQTQNSHLHVSWDKLNMLDTLDAPRQVPLRVLFHNNPGTLTFVRWSDGSAVKQVIRTDWTPGGDQSEAVYPGDLTLTIDPAKFDASGWREVRITANRGEPEREFTTSRLCVFVENGKPRSDYCNTGPAGSPQAAGRCGGGSWYPVPEYRIVFIDCRDVKRAQEQPTRGGDTFRIKAQDGPLTATLDPAFHTGNEGRVLLRDAAANTWHTVRIPADIAPGVHKLHMRATAPATGEAGVHVLTFLTPETQP